MALLSKFMGVWGKITGTLSSQTDLQTALDERLKLDQTTPQTVTGGIPVSVQATAPDNPVAGVLYVNSTDHKLYIYYNNSWQELHELAYTPPTPAVGSPFGLWLGLWRTYN